MKVSIIPAFLILTSIVCISSAAPEPAVVQGPQCWTVDMKFEPLQQITMRLDAQNKPKRFWYLIVTLTNNTNDEADFFPKCELMTDTFQIISADKHIPPTVFEQIRKRHQGRYSFLEFLGNTGSQILQGEDNTKDIVIIWPDFDIRAKNAKLYISGLSNETVAIDHPLAKDENGKPVKVFLRKTLELSYAISGDPTLRSDAKLTFKGERWVMR